MKKEEVIYCIGIILVLILVYFGDDIMLKMIPSDPNKNNTVFGGKIKEVNYENNYVTKITLDDMINKINAHEDFYVALTRSDCFVCNEIFANQTLFENSKYPIYYIERTNDENKNNIEILNNNLKNNSEITPYFIKVEKGFITDELLVNNSKDERIKNFFN